jgi:hypothetical protein
VDTTTAAILAASMLAKELIIFLQTNPNPTEAQLTALIATQTQAIRGVIDTINADMAKYSGAPQPQTPSTDTTSQEGGPTS